MWKPFDNGARNMGVESSPYHLQASEVENFYNASPSQYMNGILPEQTVSHCNRRPTVHYHQVFKSDAYNNVTRLQSPYIEHTPQLKHRSSAEVGFARKRLKLDSERTTEPKENNEFVEGSENLTDSSNESKECNTQLAPFFSIHLDNETLSNLKKILESSETSAIEANKSSDLRGSGSKNETCQSSDSHMQSSINETEKLPDLQSQPTENETEKPPDLQKDSNDNRKETVSNLEKIDIPFHKVQLDTTIWENLKKITVSPLLKNSDNSAECSTSQDDSLLLSQSTKSEMLTESSLSQGDSSLLSEQTPKVELKHSETVENKQKMSGDPWFINEKDMLNHVSNKTPGSVNRVRKSSLTCHSCGERGHSARFCTKLKKLPVCFICAREGHTGEFCRDVICSRCMHIGHPPERCHWFDRENFVCSMCRYPGHYTPECPDFWRRYHLTTIPGHVVCPPHRLVTNRIFCYNCAEEGHLGHDCEEERIDPYSVPYYPFIVDYNIPRIQR